MQPNVCNILRCCKQNHHQNLVAINHVYLLWSKEIRDRIVMTWAEPIVMLWSEPRGSRIFSSLFRTWLNEKGLICSVHIVEKQNNMIWPIMREMDPTEKSKTFRTSGSFTFSSIPRLCWTSLKPQLRICSLWTIRSVMPILHVECAPSAAVHRPSLGWMLARQIAQVPKRRAMKTFPILNNVCVKNTYIPVGTIPSNLQKTLDR